MSNDRPQVAIIGGGIGGLFAANALIAQGLDVTVYEQAPELGEIGAGFYVTPNSVRQLERVGLGAAVEKWGALVGENSQYLRHAGTPMHRCRHTLHNFPSPAVAARTTWLPGLRADLTSRPDPPIVLGHTDLPPSMAGVGPSNGGTAFGWGRTVHI